MKYLLFVVLLSFVVLFGFVGCSDIASLGGDDEIASGIKIDALTFDQGMYDAASFAFGGILYSRFWIADEIGTFGAEPTAGLSANHPLWPGANTKKKLLDTWRCKACHGWDYAGREGVYGNTRSKYYTDIKGLISVGADAPTYTTEQDIFDFIDQGTVETEGDHAFGLHMGPEAVHALTKFVITIQQEAAAGQSPRDFIDVDTMLVTGGDAANGKVVYDMATADAAGSGGCDVDCHGPDGRLIELDGDERRFVDTYAWANPMEVLHKIRFGQGGAAPAMPGLEYSGYANGLGVKDAIDVLRYTQDGLIPTVAGFDITQYAKSHDDRRTDFSRGGILYDKWWTGTDEVAPLTAPGDTQGGNHGLWPADNTNKTLDATWRCKSCHGWDYIGVAGTYGNPDSSYFTGIKGIVVTPDGTLPMKLAPPEIFDMLHSGEAAAPGDHAFNGMISNDDLYALTRFVASVQEEAIDGKSVNDLIERWDEVDPNDPSRAPYAVVKGDPVRGMMFYDLVPWDPVDPQPGQGGCGGEACHGDDGRLIVLDQPDNAFGVHDYARDNPWEILHKTRFGQPGSDMMGTEDYHIPGLDIQGAVDIMAYSQAGVVRDKYFGGRLYDNWMTESGIPAPSERHIIMDWAAVTETFDPSALSDPDTWRCSLCHGWDFQGDANLWNDLFWLKETRDSKVGDFYYTLKSGYPVINDAGGYQVVHNFGDFMPDQELWNLAEFIMNGVVDTTKYIRVSGAAYELDESAAQLAEEGMEMYDGMRRMMELDEGGVPTTNSFDCLYCHNQDGLGQGGIDIFASAWDDPWRWFHKTRFGAPGTGMLGLERVAIPRFDGKFHPGGAHDVVDLLGFAQFKKAPAP